MAANSTPIFTITPVAGIGQITTANTLRDGSGSNFVTIKTAGSFGTRIEYIRVVATGTVTTGVVRLWINDGSTNFLWKELLVTATTPSTSVEVFTVEYIPTKALVLPSGYSLKATTHNTETFNVIAHGGDY